MVTLTTLERLTELEERLAALGLETYRAAVDEALRALGGPGYRFVRTGEAARVLGVSIPTIKRWARKGILPMARVGGRWLIPAQSVERLKQAAPRLRGRSGSLEELGTPLPSQHQRRMLALGRKANRGTLTEAEEREYRELIAAAEARSARAAIAAIASRTPDWAFTLDAEARRVVDHAE
jgi:excisionase family DNA binding protein